MYSAAVHILACECAPVSYLSSPITGGIPLDAATHSARQTNKKKTTKFKVWYSSTRCSLLCYCEIMREIRNLSNHSNLKRKHARISLARTHHTPILEKWTERKSGRREEKRNHIHLARRRSSDSPKFKRLRSRDIYFFTPSPPPSQSPNSKRKLTHPNETEILGDIWHTFKWHRQWCEREPKISTDLNKSQPNDDNDDNEEAEPSTLAFMKKKKLNVFCPPEKSGNLAKQTYNTHPHPRTRRTKQTTLDGNGSISSGWSKR